MRRSTNRQVARHARFEKSVGEERWLVSYADFITLLFAFFVVMYSVSQVNESKYRSLSETLNAAFANHPSGVGENVGQQNLADLTDIEQALTEQLSGFPIEGQLRMSANESWVELSLSSEFLFASGSAEANANASGLLSELADVLSGFDNEVQIVGHTDDVPISNAQFSNNWELSSARAVAIVNTLAFQGLDPQRLSATGFGEHRPIADNTTEEGRKRNRRVVIRVGSRAAEPTETEQTDSLEGAEARLADELSPPSQNPLDPAIIDEPTNAAPGVDETNGGALKPLPNGIAPLRLKGGDLLFTSDADLPRTREFEDESLLPDQDE